MKKKIMKFTENILNKSQLRLIKGAYGNGSTCTAVCKQGNQVTCEGVYKCEAVNYSPNNGEADGFCLSYANAEQQWPTITWCGTYT